MIQTIIPKTQTIAWLYTWLWHRLSRLLFINHILFGPEAIQKIVISNPLKTKASLYTLIQYCFATVPMNIIFLWKGSFTPRAKRFKEYFICLFQKICLSPLKFISNFSTLKTTIYTTCYLSLFSVPITFYFCATT